MKLRRGIVIGIVLLLYATVSAAASEPKRVLILDLSAAISHHGASMQGTFARMLVRLSLEPIDLYEASLATARFAGDQQERPIRRLPSRAFCRPPTRSGHHHRWHQRQHSSGDIDSNCFLPPPCYTRPSNSDVFRSPVLPLMTPQSRNYDRFRRPLREHPAGSPEDQ